MKIIKVNMDDMISPKKRHQNLDLGPVHPVPSKLNIMEITDRLVNVILQYNVYGPTQTF